MSRLAVAVVVLLGVAKVAADPCPACARGDALVARFALQPLHDMAGELAAPLTEPVPAGQYARLVELRRRTPALARVGALDDTELLAVASSLCHAATGDCVDATARTLRCLADRCAVDLPKPPPRRADLVVLPADCQSYTTHKHSIPYGLGVDWGSGWQRSQYPSDGYAWSFGIEGRMRLSRTFGTVARFDRASGRDRAEDADHNGKDDISTGAITRITALAGPTIVLDNTRFDDSLRFFRVDLLGGYLSTRSQPGESGPAAGIDVAYQIWDLRFGVRAVQGFGDAHDATMVLGHIGFVGGSRPGYDDDTDCGAVATARSTPLALGLDVPISGYGISSELGYMVPSLGLEALWHLSHHFDAMVRADLLIYPGYERDRVMHQALLAGVRIDHGAHHHNGYFTTVAAGYSVGATLTPTDVGSGPIVDVSLGWGAQDDEGAAYLRLHARSGVGPDNVDYRAVFFSFGGELRVDPRHWRDRI